MRTALEPPNSKGAVVDFVAIDVETANPNLASICQVGIAGFRDGVLAFEWKSYVDPRITSIP